MRPGQAYELLRSRLAHVRSVPAVATVQVLARTTGWLYLTGGLLVLAATLQASRWSGAHLTGIRTLAVLSVLVGPLVVWAGHRLPRPVYHLLVGVGTALITAQVILGNGGAASVALAVPYVYVIIDASFFFGGVGLACHVTLVLVASALAYGVQWTDTVDFAVSNPLLAYLYCYTNTAGGCKFYTALTVIGVGGTVNFGNFSAGPMTLTFDDPSTITGGNIVDAAKNSTSVRVFTAAGTYTAKDPYGNSSIILVLPPN